jgi:hypothetical protein
MQDGFLSTNDVRAEELVTMRSAYPRFENGTEAG